MNPFRWLADLGRQLGVAGVLFLFVMAVAAWLLGAVSAQILHVLDGLTRLLERLLGPQWKPVAGVGVLVAVGWAVLRSPLRGPVVVAVATGAVTAWWLGGVYYGHRYGVRDSVTGAWLHHWRTRASAAEYDRAAKAATGRDGIKLVSRVELDPTTDLVTYEPPDGMSAVELAAQINEGKWDSAIRRRVGRVVAGPLEAAISIDGTVAVRVPHNPPARPAGADLSEAEWWTL